MEQLLWDDGFIIVLNVILWDYFTVYHLFLGQEVYSIGFLRQRITHVFFVSLCQDVQQKNSTASKSIKPQKCYWIYLIHLTLSELCNFVSVAFLQGSVLLLFYHRHTHY